jgi:hypothetical protein
VDLTPEQLSELFSLPPEAFVHPPEAFGMGMPTQGVAQAPTEAPYGAQEALSQGPPSPQSDPYGFGVPEPSFDAPTLTDQPNPGFLQSALMSVLSGVPNFAPAKLKHRDFQSAMGVILPTLARGVGAGIESGVRNRQANVNAKNQAAMAVAKANLEAKRTAYGPKIAAKSAESVARIASTGAMARELAKAPPAPPKTLTQIEAEAEARARGGRRGAPPIVGSGGGGMNASEDETTIALLVDGVKSGNQEPPSTTALFRTKGGRQFLAGMQKQGINMAKLRTDWSATQQFYRTQNTRPFVMLRTQMDNANSLFDQYEALSDHLAQIVPDYKVTGLNRLMQTLQSQGLGSTDAAQTIQKMYSIAPGLKSEMANVYMGGGVPTDHAMRLADNFVDPTLSHERRAAQIDIGRFEIGVRRNALSTAGIVGTSRTPGQTGVVGGGAVDMVWDDKQKKYVPPSGGR